MMGKEISKSGQPLRWMYKPSKDGSSPNAWSSTIGSIDVHYSSGPNNRMFYFLSQGSNATPSSDYYSSYLNKTPLAMTGIGNDKAYRIWFKALTTKFTASTNYADARNKVLLVGAGTVWRRQQGSDRGAARVRGDQCRRRRRRSGGGGGVAISSHPASVTRRPRRDRHLLGHRHRRHRAVQLPVDAQRRQHRRRHLGRPTA